MEAKYEVIQYALALVMDVALLLIIYGLWNRHRRRPLRKLACLYIGISLLIYVLLSLFFVLLPHMR